MRDVEDFEGETQGFIIDRDAVREGDLRVSTPDGTAYVDRAEFLAAVAEECGVLVIDKADLPDVEPRPLYPGYVVGGALMGNSREDWTVRETRALAFKWLALAEYLDAHPPVDEAQVEALARALHEPYPDCGTWEQNRELARRLVAAGWRKGDGS